MVSNCVFAKRDMPFERAYAVMNIKCHAFWGRRWWMSVYSAKIGQNFRFTRGDQGKLFKLRKFWIFILSLASMLETLIIGHWAINKCFYRLIHGSVWVKWKFRIWVFSIDKKVLGPPCDFSENAHAGGEYFFVYHYDLNTPYCSARSPLRNLV